MPIIILPQSTEMTIRTMLSALKYGSHEFHNITYYSFTVDALKMVASDSTLVT